MKGQISKTLLSQHVKSIETALMNARGAFFEVVMTIKSAKEDLGEDILQKELATRLSISPSTLSKYLRIADCNLILKNQDNLPSTLTTLYSLAQTHSELVKAEGSIKAEIAFKKLLEKINKKTEANDVAPLLKKAKERASKFIKLKRETKILGLSNSKACDTNKINSITCLSEVINHNTRYRTIFINPPSDIMKWASDGGVFASDIDERYPIAELRAPSSNKTVQGFIYCQAREIDGGLKFLRAAGFEYRDIFFPSSGMIGFDLIRDEKILIRGERGHPTRPTLNGEVENSLEGALAIAENLGSAPRLFVFATEEYESWTCSN